MALLMAQGFEPGNRPALEESVDDQPNMEQTGERNKTGPGVLNA